MEPLDIQYFLRKKGISQADLARKLGVSPMAISMVIHKRMISDRIMKEISEIIGKDHRYVFGEYYYDKKRQHDQEAA